MANIVFGIAGRSMVSTHAITIVILFMLSNWNIIFDRVRFFFCDTIKETLKSTNKTKNLSSCQDVGTRWNSTYLMLERLKKLKSGVRYYVANYKNDQDSIIKAKEWQLVNHIFLLLKLFFVTKECSKNNAFLLSMKPHANH